MKLNGIFGKGSGKVGESVWAVSGGVQIVRPYNPNVSNPQTPAQTEQRAKFKLMSQIAADLASVIAFPKEGLKSARNQFVSKNLSLAEFSAGAASVELHDLQLTKGTAAVGSLDASINANTGIVCTMADTVTKGISRVVYVLVKADDNQRLEVVNSAVVSEPGQNNDFSHTFPIVAGHIVAYAYGIKNETTKGSLKLGNYKIETADDVAKLVTSGSLTVADGILTETTARTVG